MEERSQSTAGRARYLRAGCSAGVKNQPGTNQSTALVVRPGEADIRFYERGAAERLERQGIGAIHGGKFVMMVDVTPRWVQLAIAARGRQQGAASSY